MTKKTTSLSVIGILSIACTTILLQATPVLAEDCTYSVYSGKVSADVHVTDGYVDITNHTSTCTYHVGVASYQMFVAPRDWNDPHGSSPDLQWLLTQQLYNYSETDLQSGTTSSHDTTHDQTHDTTHDDHNVVPNSTSRLYFRVPSCAYQIDTYVGHVITNFVSGGEDYDDQGSVRAILSNISQKPFSDNLPLCVHPTPTPTATPTFVPTPTATPLPTPYPTCDSHTAGTYVNGVYCPVITPVLTPTPTPTPTGQVLGATPTPTPPPSLPTTGPEVTALLPLLGVVGGLLGKKYFLGH